MIFLSIVSVPNQHNNIASRTHIPPPFFSSPIADTTKNKIMEKPFFASAEIQPGKIERLRPRFFLRSKVNSYIVGERVPKLFRRIFVSLSARCEFYSFAILLFFLFIKYKVSRAELSAGLFSLLSFFFRSFPAYKKGNVGMFRINCSRSWKARWETVFRKNAFLCGKISHFYYYE